MKKFFKTAFFLLVLCGLVVLGGWLYKQDCLTKYQKALGLYQEGKDNESLAIFEQLKARAYFDENKLSILYYYAILKGKTNPAESAKIWGVLLRSEVSQDVKAEATFSLGKIEFDKENYDEALKNFNNVIENYPASAIAYVKSVFYLGQMEQAKGLEHFMKARELYEKALSKSVKDPVMDQIIEKLSYINGQLLFSPVETPEGKTYKVNPGDSFATIANRFNTTIDLLRESNRLPNNFIRPHDLIKVPTVVFSIKISKKKNTLTLLANGNFFKQYRVGTGKYNKTPEGKFKITNKLKEPVWYKPDGGIIPFGDPGNLLGTRWMGINFPGYGIHGTWDTASIGHQSSAGCVRLLNSDVEELYKIVPIGTEVLISE